MTDQEADDRLRELLSQPSPAADQAFVDRVLLATRVDQQLRAARSRNLRRALIECSAAVAVGASFFLMSQMGGSVSDGIILPVGPAMAGMVMLLLWSAVALPVPRRRIFGEMA